MTESMWSEMVAYAQSKGLKKGDYKNLNIVFENRLLGQAKAIRDRMTGRVADFVYNMFVNVLNAADTAPLAIEAILQAGSHDLGPKAVRIENPDDWTPAEIVRKASTLGGDKGPKGNFDD